MNRKYTSTGFQTVYLLSALVLAGIVFGLNEIAANAVMSGSALGSILPLQNLIEGHGFTLRGQPTLLWPPGYGLLAAPVMLVTGSTELGALSVAVVAFLALLVIVYFGIAARHGSIAGVTGAVLVCYAPYVFSTASALIVDLAFVSMYVAAFFLYTHANDLRRSRRRYLMLGLLLGLAYLARPEAALVIVLIPSVLIVRILANNKASVARLQTTQLLIVFLIPIILLGAPYISYLSAEAGHFQLSGKTSINLYVGEQIVLGDAHVQELKESHPEYFEPSYGVSIFGYIVDQPVLVIRRYFAAALFYIQMGMLFLGILVVPIVIALRKRTFSIFSKPGKSALKHYWQMAIFVSPLMVLPLFAPRLEIRFFMPYVVLLLVVFFTFVWGEVQSRAPHTGYYGFAALIAVVAVVAVMVPRPGSLPPDLFTVARRENPSLPAKHAGIWLAEQTELQRPLGVISRDVDRLVLYYANEEDLSVGNYYELNEFSGVCELSEFMYSSGSLLVLFSQQHSALKDADDLWSNDSGRQYLGLRVLNSEQDDEFKVISAERASVCTAG